MDRSLREEITEDLAQAGGEAVVWLLPPGARGHEYGYAFYFFSLFVSWYFSYPRYFRLGERMVVKPFLVQRKTNDSFVSKSATTRMQGACTVPVPTISNVGREKQQIQKK